MCNKGLGRAMVLLVVKCYLSEATEKDIFILKYF